MEAYAPSVPSAAPGQTRGVAIYCSRAPRAQARRTRYRYMVRRGRSFHRPSPLPQRSAHAKNIKYYVICKSRHPRLARQAATGHSQQYIIIYSTTYRHLSPQPPTPIRPEIRGRLPPHPASPVQMATVRIVRFSHGSGRGPKYRRGLRLEPGVWCCHTEHERMKRKEGGGAAPRLHGRFWEDWARRGRRLRNETASADTRKEGRVGEDLGVCSKGAPPCRRHSRGVNHVPSAVHLLAIAPPSRPSRRLVPGGAGARTKMAQDACSGWLRDKAAGSR